MISTTVPDKLIFVKEPMTKVKRKKTLLPQWTSKWTSKRTHNYLLPVAWQIHPQLPREPHIPIEKTLLSLNEHENVLHKEQIGAKKTLSLI